MSKEIRVRAYISIVGLAAAAVTATAHVLWPATWEASSLLVMALIAGLVFLGDRFPIKLSPQADASLFTVPLFTGVLLLNPVQAGIAGGIGILLSEAVQRRPARVAFFNAVSGVFVAVSSGIAFWMLKDADAALSLSDFRTLGAVAASGALLEFLNMSVVAGIVTVIKGSGFWGQWVEAWANDTVQELGALALGFLAAFVAVQALWAVLLLVLPLAVAYVAFHRSVDEIRRRSELAERNAGLASELQARLEELEEAQTELIMQSEKLASVGVTAASVVHEVKNAMAVTAGRAELLLRHSELFLKSERAVDHVRGISDMTFRVSSLVQELLAYSRPDNSFESIQISDAMNVAANLVERKAMTSSVVIERNFGHTPSVRGVSNKLQQVFMNMLMNAVDAMPSGGTITMSCKLEGDKVIASVKDTGTGIAESTLARIFEPFFTTKEKGKGTGLGMFVCKKIITDHDGEILVHSAEGAGTEFIIALPTAESTRDAEQPVAGGVEQVLMETKQGLSPAHQGAAIS